MQKAIDQACRTWLPHLWAVALLLLPAGLAGCRRAPPPAADHLTAQVTRDFFQALGQNDLQAADHAARRLLDLHPGQDSFVRMRDRNLLAIRLEGARRLLLSGRLDEAERLLRLTQKELAVQPELTQALDLVSALQAVERYRRRLPFAASVQAEAELNALLAYAAPLAAAPRYQEWLAGERRTLADLKRREACQRYRQLVAAYDRGLLAGEPRLNDLAAPIRELALDDARLERARHHLLASTAADLEALAATDRGRAETLLADPDLGAGLEVALARAWPSFTDRTRNEIARLALPPTSTTASGLLLRARVAHLRGNPAQAATWAEKLLRRQAIAPALYREGVAALLLPADQLRTGEWLRPFPTVTDLFKRLDQLRRAEARP